MDNKKMSFNEIRDKIVEFYTQPPEMKVKKIIGTAVVVLVLIIGCGIIT